MGCGAAGRVALLKKTLCRKGALGGFGGSLLGTDD